MSTKSAKPANRHGLRDLEEMWSGLLACGWRSLAVVPTDHTVPLQALVDSLGLAARACEPAVRCIDARGCDIARAKHLAEELAAPSTEKSRAVVIVDSLLSSLAGLHLVKEANAILLVVRLGSMDHESIRSTLAIVGVERVVGSVAAPLADGPR